MRPYVLIRTVRWARIVLYAILPVVLLFAFVVDLNPSGVRSLQYRLDRPQALISPLFPAHRLSAITEGAQRVLEQPVYFKVRYPHRYEYADLRVVVETAPAVWRIGLEVTGAEWSYALLSPDRTGFVRFDLQNAKITDGNLRFIISIDRLESMPFMIREVQITFHRESLFETLKRMLWLS